MRTRSTACAAALALAASFAPGQDAPPVPDEAEWDLLRNDAGSLEIRVPPKWKEFPQVNPAVTLAVDYRDPPFKNTGVVALTFKWTHPMPDFHKFVEKEIAGTPQYDYGSKTRFRVDKSIDGNDYAFLLDSFSAGGLAHYVRIGGPKSGYEERKAEWLKILDSVKALEPPPPGYAVPEGWRAPRPTAMFHVMGPASDPADAREKQRFEAKLGEIQGYLSANDDRMKLLRSLAGENRSWIPRRPVHVLPSAESFRAACGGVDPEGAAAVYLPEHPERIVVVDGATASESLRDEVAAAAGVSYFEGRMGGLPPWLRLALHPYLLNAFRTGLQPGLVPLEFLGKAVPAFAKSPPSFEQVLKMDDAAAKELDAAGRLVPWCYLQYALHGPDENLRAMFQEFLKFLAAPGTDAAAAWEQAAAGYKTRGKRTFRPRDLDSATRDYVKALSAAPPPRGSDWPVVTNDMETLHLRVPPGWVPRETTKASVVISIRYPDPPYKEAFILGYSLDWAGTLEQWMRFVESEVPGTRVYDEGSATRFRVETNTDSSAYVYFVDACVEGRRAYYVNIASPRAVFDEMQDDWTLVLDSMKATPQPTDRFRIPEGWQALKPALMFHVMGPSSEVKDPKARKEFENRLFKINALLDESQERMRMIKEQIANDQRKWMLRRPVHVLPTAESFKAACGAAWVEGAGAVYLPDHPEKVLVVDGSPEARMDDDEISAVAGVSYLEGRLGRLAPWMRSAFTTYMLNGFRRNCTPGLYPPEAIKAADAAFSKNPPSFEAVLKMGEAEVRGLDEAGRLVLWGYLQYGFSGGDSHVRNLFRGFLAGSVGAVDSGPAWERAVEAYKAQSKKTFKPKDLDSPTRKYIRDLLKAERK